MPHPALSSSAVAVVTGGASGIGLAAAKAFARLGLRLCIADLGEERVAAAASAVSAVATGGAAHVMTVAIDVSRADEVTRLEAAVRERFGGTDVLMNNAGIQPGSAMFGPRENWRADPRRQSLGRDQRHAGVRAWHDRARTAWAHHQHRLQTGHHHAAGDPAYNVSKAGVKAFTEALQHELRNMPKAAGSPRIC